MYKDSIVHRVKKDLAEMLLRNVDQQSKLGLRGNCRRMIIVSIKMKVMDVERETHCASAVIISYSRSI